MKQGSTAAATTDPDARATALIDEMTPFELQRLLYGHTSILTKAPRGDYEPANGLGFVPGVPRLGVPTLRQTDGQMGVGDPAGDIPGAQATQLPSGLALAATWDLELARAAGVVLGREAQAKGFNVVLAGSVNLIRDPRCGRCFEYPGEDPLLAGSVIGGFVRGVQSATGVICTVKHFALNSYESGRMQQNVLLDRAAAMESDLLALRLAIAIGDPGVVMTSYNALNGAYASENAWLLTTVLRDYWQFKGWTMSDFGGVHSAAKAALAGLDQESACESDRIVALGAMSLLNGKLPRRRALARVLLSYATGDIRRRAWFGRSLAQAVASGEAPRARLREMAHRIVRTLAKHGVLDAHHRNRKVDLEAHAATAKRVALEGAVLLKNADRILPLSPQLGSIAVIGRHADVGLPSGNGSSIVLPIGGNAIPTGRGRLALLRAGVWTPCSPLRCIAAKAPRANIRFVDGADAAQAQEIAHDSDVAIIFAHQLAREGADQESLSLPHGQDRLIASVAAANPRCIVVLSCSGPVAAPWLEATGALMCAWYSGQRGAEAVADILFGDAEPAGRLPVTFPRSLENLPRPQLPPAPEPNDGSRPQYDLRFEEGAKVGYRWFDSRALPVLFPFGFGLSYTHFRYDELIVLDEGGANLRAVVRLANCGDRPGVETVQIYIDDVETADAHTSRRMAGWARIRLEAGANGQVEIAIPPFILGRWDEAIGLWRIDAGARLVHVGASSRDLRLTRAARVEAGFAPA